ncbi:MAG: sulfatase-like hydrolase/transferase [Candidatus Marinimicrobia bacterium]|nr:sulfatase-like hydrolase/transferase [Candidatus Neomarinimicrobiota bacterium]
MERPNILYILADDLGWGDLSLHGSPIRTPNIDQLAREGVELTQHYVCPMCTPTRASLLTGRYPSRFGPHGTVPSNAPVFPDGYQTLATILRDAGYDTGLFGKWHLGSAPQYGPNQYGFNTAYGSLAGGIDPYSHRYKRGEFSVAWHRNGTLVEERGHVTDLILNEAREWIETRNQPWFCYVPFTAVHIPIKPTQEWMARYYPEQFDDDPLKDRSYKMYAAYTSHMDHAIGQLLETLEQLGQRENTIIVFSSDNGAVNETPLHATDQYPGWQEAYPRLGSNAPWRGVKAQLYEGGIRTPTLVNWRSRLTPGRMEHPVQVTDWMPSFSALVGAPPKEDPRYDGRDIWPLITGETKTPAPRHLFWNFKGDQHLGLRLGDWKLIVNHKQGHSKQELFNLADDPYEQNDQASDRPDKVAELAALIAAERQADNSSARSDVAGPRMP